MTTKQRRGEQVSVLRVALTCVCAVLLIVPFMVLRADIVEMQNGDRYAGSVLSLDTNSLVLQSEVLGKIKLPRTQVAKVYLGQKPADASAAMPPKVSQPSTRPVTNVAEFSRELAANSNLVNQVQSEYLGAAGPEANRKFHELMGGLMSGKLTISDLRKEAKGAADQLRSLQKELGEDGAGVLDGYLAILDSFLKESAPVAQTAGTNAANSKAVTPQQ